MGKNLAIYGSGGLGHEILELARQVNSKDKRWDNFVFVNDFSQNKVEGIDVYSFEELLKIYFKKDLEIIVAVGNPNDRRNLWEKIKKHNLDAATIIHPNVEIPKSALIKRGVVIFNNAFISCNTVLGENTCIQMNSIVAHNSIVKKHTIISPLTAISGNCSIGECTFVGTGSCIKEKITIGNNVIVSMGAVVMQDIKNNFIVMGNPARTILKNTKNQIFKQ